MFKDEEERRDLEQKLEQAWRLTDGATDPMTVARLTQLILDLEEALREAK